MGKNANKSGSQKSEAAFGPRLIGADAASALSAIGEAGDNAAELVELWIRGNNVGAVVAVASADAVSSAARKAARRGLNVFKSRGLSWSEPAASPLVQLSATEPVFEAWFTLPDQNSVATYTIGLAAVGQRYEIADVRLHELAGVVDVNSGEATRGSIRGSFRKIEERYGYQPAPVSVAWARWRIAEAKKCNARSGLVIPMGFESAASLLTPVPDAEPPHPVDAAGLVVTDEDIANRSAASGTLHNEPEFRPWLPDDQSAQEIITKIGERLGSTPSDDREERVKELFNEELSAATDRFFTPEVRERIAARMKDAAVSVLARAGRERAMDVLAAAEASRRCGLITSPPSELPFLSTFFNKAIAVIASQQGGKLSIPLPAGPDPSRGIVAPAEAFAEAAKTASGKNADEPTPAS